MRKERLAEVELELAEPSVWSEPERARDLGRERASLETTVHTIEKMDSSTGDARDLLELAASEDDEATVAEIQTEIDGLIALLEKLEFRRMFAGEMDPNNAYLDIQSGSGGTEAQDWAEMLLRMYLRWGEAKGFNTELIEASGGDVAGIKSATMNFEGENAFAW